MGKVSSDPPSKSNVSSRSEGSFSRASKALLQQSDCVKSASEQVGVLGACTGSVFGSRTGSRSPGSEQASRLLDLESSFQE